jgi:PAS domain S-box-containing protein
VSADESSKRDAVTGFVEPRAQRAPRLEPAAGHLDPLEQVGTHLLSNREKAQAEEALRQSEAKYRTLFDALDQGFFLIDVIFDEDGQLADLLYLEANPAATRMLGQDYTGRRLSEIDPHFEPYWYEIFARVAQTGQAVRAERYAETLDAWYDFYVFKPAHAEDDGRVANTFRDITARKRRQMNADLLADVSEALDRLSLPGEMVEVVGDQVKGFFGVTGPLSYNETNEERDLLTCLYDDNQADFPDAVRTHSLSEYVSAAFLSACKAGRVIAIEDVALDPRTAPQAEAYAARAVRSQLVTPFTADGRLIFTIALAHKEVRSWRPDEIELMEEVATRLHLHLQRARAEAALRESEARYRELFTSITEGFCVFEVLFDAHGKPVDYRWLETNPAFEQHTGLVDAVGKTARELVPDLEHHWIEIYGRIALTGEPERFVEKSEVMGRWFEVDAFRIGEPEDRKVALLFTNISERKQAEEALQESERRLAEEVSALKRLHQMTGRVVTAHGMQAALDEVLNAAVELLGADFGTIQLLNPESRTLAVVAQTGFQQSYVDAFAAVSAADDIACGRALRLGERVIVENIHEEPGYEPFRAGAAAAGYQAVQSTPLISHRGQLLGMLSTHYRQPHALSVRDVRLLDLLARHATDLLDRLRAEEVLEQRVQERTAQVRRLASELVTAEQQVRARISQTLHDDLQQMLYAAEMQLHFLRDDLVLQKDGLAELSEMIGTAIHLTRTLTVELSPPVLKGEGLRETLEWLARHMGKVYGLQVTVEASVHTETASQEQRVLLFQSVRELLFNVVKHAGVREAAITLREEEKGITITVSEHGRGFDVAAVLAEGSGGYGLRSLHERLQLLDGRADIDSQPGAGTRVNLFLPRAHMPDSGGLEE